MNAKMSQLFIAMAAAVLLSAQSHAAFVQSTNAASAGFTTTTTYGFTEAGLPANTIVTNQYSGVTFSPNLVQDPQSCSGFNANMTDPCLGNFLDGGITDPWEILFSGTQTQAGFHFITNQGTTVFEAYLGATLVESASAGTDPSSTSNFFGFSGISFDRIRVDTGGLNNAMLMDNLTFNAVPEPSSLALLGLVLAGLAASSPRRKKSAAHQDQ